MMEHTDLGNARRLPASKIEEWSQDPTILAEAEHILRVEQSALRRIRIIRALEDIAFSDAADLFTTDRQGRVVLKPFNQLTPQQRSLIQSLKITPNAWGRTADVKLLDRMAALNLLARIEQMTGDGTNISIRNGIQLNQNGEAERLDEIKVTYVDGPIDGLLPEEGTYEDGETPRLTPVATQADSETPSIQQDIEGARARTRK